MINLRTISPYVSVLVLAGAFTAPQPTLMSTLAYTLTTNLDNTPDTSQTYRFLSWDAMCRVR